MIDFYFKLASIVGAIVCMRFLYTRVFRDRVVLERGYIRPGTKAIAATLLTLWVAAITGGRLTAYDDTHTQWVTAVATLVVSVILLAAGYVLVRLWHLVKAALTTPAAHDVPLPQSRQVASR
jgi:hypothetical protein